MNRRIFLVCLFHCFFLDCRSAKLLRLFSGNLPAIFFVAIRFLESKNLPSNFELKTKSIELCYSFSMLVEQQFFCYRCFLNFPVFFLSFFESLVLLYILWFLSLGLLLTFSWFLQFELFEFLRIL